MPFPRIFVSHSAKDKHAEETLDAVEAALNREFDVFIDRVRLHPGQLWRNELFTRMAHAHGAVILFSEHVFESEFVPTEVSALGWRRHLDEDFILLPVLLGDVTVERVEEEFAAVTPGELQVIKDAGPAQVAAAVRQALLPLIAKQAAQTPFDKLERMIVNALRGVPEDALRGAAQTLGSDLDVWAGGTDLPTRLARELWQADLIESTRAINDNLRPYLDERQTENLIELVAPSWVDLRLAGLIPGVARGECERRALGVNGTKDFTALMFVRRACCRGHMNSWKLATITATDMTTESLRAEIAAALKDKFKIQGADDALLHRLLEKQEGGLKEPVFVMFPPPPPPPEVLTELRAIFPTVTFFLLTGEQLPAPGEAGFGHFQTLAPGLQPGEEDEAYVSYTLAKST